MKNYFEKVPPKLLNKYLEAEDAYVQVHFLIKFFFRIYKNNPKEFYVLFDEPIIEYYGNTLCLFCERISDAIINPHQLDNIKRFKISNDGLHPYLEFSKKKNDRIVEDIYKKFRLFAETKWSI